MSSIISTPYETQLLHRRLLTPRMLDEVCRVDTETEYIVNGIVPRGSVGILGGDSGLGKTPLIYQLALCVASGVPFAGHKTQESPVIYYELENPTHASKRLRDSLLRFLDLQEVPETFIQKLEVPADGLRGLQDDIEAVRPSLVVIDTLREFAPDATEKNKAAAKFIRELRDIARSSHCAILLIHHVRKVNRDGNKPPRLAETSLITWLQEMEGPRAFVNHTDFRIGIEEGHGDPANLILKWNRKTYGDSPLVLFERVFDDTGEPIGYCAIEGVDLLGPEWKAAFESLGPDFRFGDAMTALKAKQGVTGRFLKACEEYRLIEKLERGLYRKRVKTAPERP